MDNETNALMHQIQTQMPDMVNQLLLLANINSGSYNLNGLKEIREQLKNFFSPLADEIEERPFQKTSVIDIHGHTIEQELAPALIIRKRPQLSRRILLTGHMDTVYGEDHPIKKCTFENDNTLLGPGVCDMKGGIIVMKTALEAFEQSTHANQLGWDVIINADEELGSPLSCLLWTKNATPYEAAFVYEPALDCQGTLAKNRPGSAKITLIAHGKSAHAGRAFHEGRNAICYLAQIILVVHALNHQRPGVTINVGKIAGGEALNQVPSLAVAKLDVRIKNSNDADWIQQNLEKIRIHFQHTDYNLEIHTWFGRPVKKVSQKTTRLFKRIKTIGHTLGLNLQWQDSGGCCDGNNLSENGLPVMDTMGVRGGKIHSKEEFMVLDSLVERAQLSTCIFMDFADKEIIS